MPQIARRHTFPAAGLCARPRRGFTLIETIIASGMAALVLGVAAAVFAAVYSTLERQADWRGRVLPAADAVDRLALDLACAVAPHALESNWFLLRQALLPGRVEPDSSLRFHAALPPAAGMPPERARLAEIRYFLDDREPGGAPALIREARLFSGGRAAPEPAERQCLARGLDAFRVQVFGGGWSNEWNALSFDELPASARIFIRVSSARGAGPREFQTEVAIPAGIEIRPPGR